MKGPTIEIVGTPDLPCAVSAIFGDKLLPAHEKVMVPDAKGGLALLGYRVSFMGKGKPMLSNVLVGDDGETYFQDDVQEMAGEPNTFVPCRTEYFVCPKCLREIRAHAHIIEGESEEDRPHPSIDDAWDQVEGCAGFCGGDHCKNPPQRVYWTKPDGTVQTLNFVSKSAASFVIANIVQWQEASMQGDLSCNMVCYLRDDPDSLIEAYEDLSSHPLGEFLRLNRDPDTGEPMMPGYADLHDHGERISGPPVPLEVLYHGVLFIVEIVPIPNYAGVSGQWSVRPKVPLPEPLPRWG